MSGEKLLRSWDKNTLVRDVAAARKKANGVYEGSTPV